jgi:hypothetical protein
MRWTRSRGSTSSRCSSVEPASIRESSSRSITNLADDEIECLAAAIGEFVAAAVEHLDGRGERSDGRTQLVADVAGEPRLALDAGLHGIGHVVERAGEPGEIGIILGRHARVESARGEVAGGLCHAGDRLQQATAGGESEERCEQRGDAGSDEQCGGDRIEVALGALHREGLEVLRIGGGDADADRDVGLAVEREALQGALPLPHGGAQLEREGVGLVADVAEGQVALQQEGEAAALVAQVAGRVDALLGEQLVAHSAGIAEGLGAGHLQALVDEVRAGDAVGGEGEDEPGCQCREREVEGDSCPQAQRRSPYVVVDRRGG